MIVIPSHAALKPRHEVQQTSSPATSLLTTSSPLISNVSSFSDQSNSNTTATIQSLDVRSNLIHRITLPFTITADPASRRTPKQYGIKKNTRVQNVNIETTQIEPFDDCSSFGHMNWQEKLIFPCPNALFSCRRYLFQFKSYIEYSTILLNRSDSFLTAHQMICKRSKPKIFQVG